MKYAQIIGNKINLIKCDAAFADSRNDVIAVDDDVQTGWHYKDGKIIKPEDATHTHPMIAEYIVDPCKNVTDDELKAIASKALSSADDLAKAFKLLCSRNITKDDFAALKNELISKDE